MEFNLSGEQKLLKESCRDFLRREFPKEIIQQAEESEKGYIVELWRKMAELGWMGLTIPENYGGSGASFFDLVVMLEEMGCNICPGPFFASTVLGALPVVKFGREDQKRKLLPKLASGELILTLGLNEREGFEASNIQAQALGHGEGWSLSGVKFFVPYGHVADYILWVGRTKQTVDPENGISVFLADAGNPGITRTVLKTLARDFQCMVEFDDAQVSVGDTIGQVDHGWTVVTDVLEKGAVAIAAEMMGGAQAVFDMSLVYAKSRIQFDHPIGSYQAIQHYLADMWTDINGSRALLYRAAWAVSEGRRASRDVAMAKARVGETYRRVTKLGHQIFGAIGYCMEHGLHRYYRRAMSGDLSFGDTDFQRERVARELMSSL